MPATVMQVTDASVKFGAVADPIDPALLTDYKCQVTEARITATSNTTTSSVPHTYCGPGSEATVPVASSFQLVLNFLQDWSNTALTSLSIWAFKNDAAKQAFALYLDDEEDPSATGVVTVVAGDFGGVAGEPLTASVTMQIDGYPDIVDNAGAPIRTAVLTAQTAAPVAESEFVAA